MISSSLESTYNMLKEADILTKENCEIMLKDYKILPLDTLDIKVNAYLIQNDLFSEENQKKICSETYKKKFVNYYEKHSTDKLTQECFNELIKKIEEEETWKIEAENAAIQLSNRNRTAPKEERLPSEIIGKIMQQLMPNRPFLDDDEAQDCLEKLLQKVSLS